ncbi:MAG: endolytic transglycosylase MltG [Thermodesulfobacteriota bacterium]
MNSAVKYVLWVMGLVAVAGAAYFYYTGFYYRTAGTVEVEIPKGMGLKPIALRLESRKVIKDDLVFVLYVKLRGSENKLKAGEYRFEAGVTMDAVVEKLLKGEVSLRRFTIAEGLTLKQIAQVLSKREVLTGTRFLSRAQDRDFVNKLLGYDAGSLEGYLFPETYTYELGFDEDDITRAMVSRYREVYDSLDTSEVNLTEHEVVTLASIIEKETSVPGERPLISAVLHNRLRIGMRLECDPTVIYGLGNDFDGNITKADLKAEHDYNTYVITGLPPGPIASPGAASLEAAVKPADVKYLYFVSKGDGTHHFSATYADHQSAVYKYRKLKR